MIDSLNQLSLRQLQARYATLPALADQARTGQWRARFVGPWWLRCSAGPSIALNGLPGWYGKRFERADAAVNLLQGPDGLRAALPMQCSEQASWLDGKPCAALSYGAATRRPWRWVRDELRVLDERHCLCLTFVDLPLLRRLAFPFVLERD